MSECFATGVSADYQPCGGQALQFYIHLIGRSIVLAHLETLRCRNNPGYTRRTMYLCGYTQILRVPA
jgi:hypothetical protein